MRFAQLHRASRTHLFQGRAATSFRVASEVDSRLRPLRELEVELRRRLHRVALVALATATSIVAVGVALDWARFRGGPLRFLVDRPFHGWMLACAISLGVVVGATSPRRRPGLRLLRTLEWITILPPATAFMLGVRRLPGELTSAPEYRLVFAQSAAAPWIWAMLMYAVFIPNTWRRCAAAIGLMVLGAAIPDLAVVLTHAWTPATVGWEYLLYKLILVGCGAASAIYGAYRIDMLRQDTLAARQLGQYVLTKPLGSGGMGEVYLAEHQFLRRPCAVKLIKPEGADDERTLARFEREVQATATLTHPNTVQVYDYGRSEDGTFYYAMEYLPGLSLEQIVDGHGPLPAARAVHILLQLCGALGEAHERGIVHRDIKPSNVIVGERGGRKDIAKLLDFGLAAAATAGTGATPSSGRLTQAGILVGTPEFMSPEQCAGEDSGPASDIYSLGALAYYLLVGRSPFAGRSPAQMLAAHLYESPKPMREHGVAVPEALEAVVGRCLAKAAEERFASVSAIAAALDECADDFPWTQDDARRWWAAVEPFR